MNLFPTNNDRELGEFGLSIATDLAVAGSMGMHPDNPLPKRPVDDYEEVWFNLATLVRNAFEAYSTEDKRRLDSQHVIDDVSEEIRAIPSIYRQVLPDDKQVVVRVYYNNYEKVGRELTRAFARTMKTELQKITFAIMQDAIKGVIENFPEEIDQYAFTLKGNHGKVLLSTHQPVDLLSKKHFRTLGLLESHTGKVKDSSLWYTKFGKDPDLKRIPFDKAMIQIFGDGNNLLSMYPVKVRRKIIEISKDKRWTHMTTREKVVSNIRSAKETELMLLINDAYR